MHNLNVLGIIPARYASTRFPGKPLVDIGGKTMIQRVYGQASQAQSLAKIVVATDDQRIFDHVKSFGGNVVMTSPLHPSGTDRCNEAVKLQGEHYDVAINIQGDEPFIQPVQIDLLATCFKEPGVQIATLVKVMDKYEDLVSPNVMKVALSNNLDALLFSRSPIPFVRNHPQDEWLKRHTFYKHIGIYAYRTRVLEQISALPQSSLELAESLEQLRWLQNGYRIKAAITDIENIAVDTPEDLKKIFL
jgi:3-deoxy-manno-octulosonate cytidylyltransferase (CMP-KDO synthetase)